ncbi:MAG: peptidyl-prolyl cis-trans isomerase [Candidatus Krumholzibacteria bacterium]|nr:peptidyl-prolyl cis-trans isomerase [Candidatus Krumholzibacteria bacterium]
MKKTILCVLMAGLALSLGCGKKENRVVARVADRKITVGDFNKAVATMDEKFLPKTNDIEGKKELLDIMINKEVMTLKALTAGYEKEKGFVEFWDRFKGQYLVASMENEYIVKKVSVTEQEAKDFFDKMHNEYQLSQILVANEDEARAIREQLAGGADFAELAKKYSLGREAGEGGFLGTSTIGNMFYWVEDALASTKEGDITQPLQTPTGWAILKVHRIRKITPEKDLQYARKKVEGDKQKKLLAEMKQKIEKDIGLVIYPEAVNIVYNNLPPDLSMEDIVTYKVTRDNAPKLEIPEQYQGMILAQYADGSYTLKDYMKIFDEIGLPERPSRKLGKEAIVESIHRRIWDSALPTYVEKQLKIQDIPEVAKGLQTKKEMMLTWKFYEDQVKNEVTVSDLEVQDYYNANKGEISSPERRAYSIILVSDKAKADQAVALARKGEDFTKLVRKFSEDPEAIQTGGGTGLVPKGNFPDYDEIAFSVPLGQVSDPFQVPRGWAVVKIDQIEAPQPMPYASAALSLRQRMQDDRAEKLLKEKLAKWRKDFTIKINMRNLKKTELSRTRPTDAVLEQKAREQQLQEQKQQQLQMP